MMIWIVFSFPDDIMLSSLVMLREACCEMSFNPRLSGHFFCPENVVYFYF